MTASQCEHEESVVRALLRGIRDEKVSAHLALCGDCRLSAELVRAIGDHVAGPSLTADSTEEARRIWLVVQEESLAATRSLIRRWQRIRLLAVTIPPLAVLLALQKFVGLRESAVEAMQTLESILDIASNLLSLNIMAACAAALAALTILATWRLAITD